jgi:hypothetical protein
VPLIASCATSVARYENQTLSGPMTKGLGKGAGREILGRPAPPLHSRDFVFPFGFAIRHLRQGSLVAMLPGFVFAERWLQILTINVSNVSHRSVTRLG